MIPADRVAKYRETEITSDYEEQLKKRRISRNELQRRYNRICLGTLIKKISFRKYLLILLTSWLCC